MAISQAAPPSGRLRPAVNAPAPVEVKRKRRPPPAASATALRLLQQKADGPRQGLRAAKRKPADKKEKKPKVLARDLFGKMPTAAALAPRALGWYAKGCLAGGVHLADTGPDWQTMRLSRNRAWGHPKLIAPVKRFATETSKDGWPGLLVGDISQPRGGPMLTGHASHQVGLDADIWLTPMPNRVLDAPGARGNPGDDDARQDEPRRRSQAVHAAHVAIIKRAASYPQVERVFVNPAIKKALCQAAGKDRAWLGKVRPIWGHNYHFHIRIGCPNGGCQVQAAGLGATTAAARRSTTG